MTPPRTAGQATWLCPRARTGGRSFLGKSAPSSWLPRPAPRPGATTHREHAPRGGLCRRGGAHAGQPPRGSDARGDPGGRQPCGVRPPGPQPARSGPGRPWPLHRLGIALLSGAARGRTARPSRPGPCTDPAASRAAAGDGPQPAVALGHHLSGQYAHGPRLLSIPDHGRLQSQERRLGGLRAGKRRAGRRGLHRGAAPRRRAPRPGCCLRTTARQ
jgi:hypothetical protein